MFSLLDIRCIPHSPQKPVYSSQAFVMQNWNSYRFFSFSPTIQPVCIALLLDIQCSPLFSRHNSEFLSLKHDFRTWERVSPSCCDGKICESVKIHVWQQVFLCCITSTAIFPQHHENFTIYSNDAQQRSDKSYQKSSSTRVRGWGVKFAYQFSNYTP